MLLERENQAVRESAEEQMQALEDEYEGRIMTVQTEMDRVLADSRVVKVTKDITSFVGEVAVVNNYEF